MLAPHLAAPADSTPRDGRSRLPRYLNASPRQGAVIFNSFRASAAFLNPYSADTAVSSLTPSVPPSHIA
ncbi:hypothetical protein BaRGS_00028882 [Batillaria attramentaria]|uniref:Uncharacterized protein n=1 Tax=Batillaria attramentaria TaxID=370345 RepID=A0ABD0JY12_9CAEN